MGVVGRVGRAKGEGGQTSGKTSRGNLTNLVII